MKTVYIIMSLLAPISVGELLDKITILQIKFENMSDDQSARANIKKELDLLEGLNTWKIDTKELYYVNLQLWVVEDELRELEKVKHFGEEFIKLARSVYTLNDKRASLKRQINIETKSDIVEEKSYK
jgi:hypothetical protein